MKKSESKIQLYLYCWFLIYGLLMLISPLITNYFSIWEDIMNWSFIGQLFGFVIVLIIYNIVKILIGLEEYRIENKRTFIFQYFYIVPRDLILFIIYTIPFLFIVSLFFYIGYFTSFYETFCLPLLSGVIGELIWYFLFFVVLCLSIYVIYKPIKRKYF
jgi:hypothetical protein